MTPICLPFKLTVVTLLLRSQHRALSLQQPSCTSHSCEIIQYINTATNIINITLVTHLAALFSEISRGLGLYGIFANPAYNEDALLM